MTDRYGHADPATLALADRLAEGVLDLIQLWIEPMHREDDAAELVAALLRIEPVPSRAVLLSAYLALHYWMDDEHLDAAAAALAGLLSRDEQVGAAALLLDEITRSRGGDHDVQLLRRSVAAEPGWSLNHVRLARALAAGGDRAGAATELDLAISNVLDPDPREDPVAHAFDTLFTGRVAIRDRIIAERAKLD